MIALAHAEIAGPGIEVMVEALMPEPHLSVQERPAPANRAWRRGGAIAAFRQLTSAHCGANHLVSDVLRALRAQIGDWGEELVVRPAQSVLIGREAMPVGSGLSV